MSAELSADDVGVAAITTSELSAEHARRVAAVLDADDDLTDGSPLPLLWHWAFFALAVSTAGLGPDGHPRMSPGGHTADLPRRMWVGGRVSARTALVVGTSATRRSRVVRAERKSGRSGDLLVVTVEHQIEQGDQIVVSEEQDLVYRGASGTPVDAPTGDHQPDVRAGGWSDGVTMDPVTLFRFSAITFNSHRIHYDLPYATAQEAYPALVVHGPLTAILLADSSRRRGRPGASFEFRASAPLFAGIPFSLVGQPDDEGTELRAERNDGTVAMTARLA
ncbi:MAG: acyl-CoA dehydrogenase [Microthrixaceae bacterium]